MTLERLPLCLIAFVATLAVGGSPSALAGPPEPVGEAAADDEAPPPPAPDELDVHAERIEALIEGRLDPSLAASPLFVLHADDGVLRRYTNRPRPSDVQEARDAPQGAEAPPKTADAAARLQRAWQSWTDLSPEQRQALLVAHQKRRAAAGFIALPEDVRAEQTRALRERRDQLAAYLKGEYVEGFDLQAATRMDLGDPLVHRELELLRSGGERVSELPRDEAESQWLEARLKLRRAQLRALALDEAAHQALREKQVAPPEPELKPEAVEAMRAADDAEVARQAAIEAAAKAKSAELRAREEARAALLGLQGELGRIEAQWAQRAEAREADALAHESLDARLNALLAMGPLDGDPTAVADELYPAVREHLLERSAVFQQRTDAYLANEHVLPSLAPLLETHGEAIDGDDELRKLRDSLRDRLAAMRGQGANLAWERLLAAKQRVSQATQLHSRLVPLVSDSVRSRHQGFHDRAVREARREAELFASELRFWRASLPLGASRLRAGIDANPLATIKGAAKILVALLLFGWWFRGREARHEELRERAREAGPGIWGRLQRSAAWMLPAVGTPLGLMLLAYFLLDVIAHRAGVPGAQLLFSLLAWVLGGRATISLLHAMAARAPGGRKGDPTATLRLRSLRVVGLTVVGTGLVATLAAQTVGRGTIYDWVLSTCWFLAIPLLLLIIAWWRPIIEQRLGELQNPSPLALWAARPRSGLGAFASAIVGGLYLFAHGIRRYLLRRATEFESTRRVLAYLVRREVARQAAERDPSAFEPLDEARLAAFDRELGSPQTRIEHGDEVFARVVHFARLSATSVTAIVAEAGGGKTVFLDRVCEAVEDDVRCLRLSAHHGGFDELREQLAEALELPRTADEAAIRQALAQSMHVIAIDDAHRLVRPTIGGLAELDALLRFARSVPDAISWLLVIEDPAFAYVRRGRGEGALFDCVARLPRWTEEQIGGLLRERSKQAGIEPDFAQLDVPQQAADDEYDEEERCEIGYYRILWDYVDGNPALALHWWRESLVQDEEGKVIVQLFVPPGATELDNLPDSLYFVLRAIVQLDGAKPAEIRSATALPRAEVENALRYLLARDLIEQREDRVAVRAHWYRAVTRVLWRRHLIIRSAA